METLPTEVFSLEISAALPPIIRISGPYEVSETCSFTLDPCSKLHSKISFVGGGGIDFSSFILALKFFFFFFCGGVAIDQSQDASMTYDPVAPSNADLEFYWSCASGSGSFDCRTLSNFGPQTWILKIPGSIHV